METNINGFLDGRVQIAQPRIGYRAATDPVYLAASVPAVAGDRVLDVGCGVGTASFCLGARVSNLIMAGIELQDDYAALAISNGVRNDLFLDVICAELQNSPPELRAQSFDHVMTNPPFFMENTMSPPEDVSKTLAHVETMGLDLWIKLALKRLKPGGSFSIIHLTNRLPSILTSMDGACGNIRILPIAARTDRPAKRVLVQGIKSSKAPMQLLSPLIVHDGDVHDQDGDDYSAKARAILRDGAALPL